MSKAITTTQLLKNLNPQLFSGTLGTIRTFGSLPKSFFSPTYNQGQRTDGYHTLNNAIHEADGFFDVVTPVPNLDTEKLGTLFFNVDKFTYPVVALSQVEIDLKNQQKEDSDNASQFFNNRTETAKIMLDRFNAFVYRKVVNSEITKTQAVAIFEFFFDALSPLRVGYFELARKRTNALVTANQGLIDLKNRIMAQIDNYLANE